MLRYWWLAVLAYLCACGGARSSSAPRKAGSGNNSSTHVIVVTVDGMMPKTYLQADALGLKIPTLRRFARDGLVSEGLLGVYPTVTLPSHVSIATGANPDRHGITTNLRFDPLGQNHERYRWYAEDIAIPTIYDAAYQAGLRTAVLLWPTTVAAPATARVPEFRLHGIPDEDVKLLRALSSPGLLPAVAKRFPDVYSGLEPVVRDRTIADIAVHVIEASRPHLLMVHLGESDTAQHEFGPLVQETVKTFEAIDRQLARLVQATERAGIAERTIFVVCSDHGFARIHRRMQPGVLLRQAGLIDVDERGRVRAWRAAVNASGGQAYIYLRDRADKASAARANDVIRQYAERPGSEIAKVLGRAEIAAVGGDPKAFLSLEAKSDVGFKRGYVGELVYPARSTVGHHGFAPTDARMNASLIVFGPGIERGRLKAGEARLIDIAPTVAAWLGLQLPTAQGRVIPQAMRK